MNDHGDAKARAHRLGARIGVPVDDVQLVGQIHAYDLAPRAARRGEPDVHLSVGARRYVPAADLHHGRQPRIEDARNDRGPPRIQFDKQINAAATERGGFDDLRSIGSGHLRAAQDGKVLTQRQLDQRIVGVADFKLESATVTVQQRLALRRLFQEAGVLEKMKTGLVCLN